MVRNNFWVIFIRHTENNAEWIFIKLNFEYTYVCCLALEYRLSFIKTKSCHLFMSSVQFQLIMHFLTLIFCSAITNDLFFQHLKFSLLQKNRKTNRLTKNITAWFYSSSQLRNFISFYVHANISSKLCCNTMSETKIKEIKENLIAKLISSKSSWYRHSFHFQWANAFLLFDVRCTAPYIAELRCHILTYHSLFLTSL